MLPSYSTDLEHDGRKYHVVLADLCVARCENCGTIILDDAASRRLSDALRNEAGLLQPAEIRAQREALGLTQKTLAGYLLIAEATLSRWETGAQIQQRAMDAFLRVFLNRPRLEAFSAFLNHETLCLPPLAVHLRTKVAFRRLSNSNHPNWRIPFRLSGLLPRHWPTYLVRCPIESNGSSLWNHARRQPATNGLCSHRHPRPSFGAPRRRKRSVPKHP